MKYAIYIGIILALGLAIFNITRVDFSRPFEGDSSIALVGVAACACAAVLLLILLLSKKIAQKAKLKG